MELYKKISISVLNKWWLIVFIALIVAAGLAYEKSKTTNFIIKTGDIWFTNIVKMENYSTLSRNEKIVDFRYPDYMKNYHTVNDFVEKTKHEVDYNRFSHDWDNKTKIEKYKWIQSHLLINDFGSGIYEVCFRLGSNEGKDLDYVVENGKRFLESYVHYSIMELNEFDKSVTLTVVSNFEVLPETKLIDKNVIVKKYAFIGFILGALLGILLVVVNCLRKEYVTR